MARSTTKVDLLRHVPFLDASAPLRLAIMASLAKRVRQLEPDATH